ncbi:hypothetical protein [Mycobacterium uberis]|uniref:hypothetical protein n=1 Tax=Mycobacterium uberis TaxID=2162698 RepID=UPI00140373D7|nr:hypothetical protein [Mycobacterium uberis]
MIFLRFNGWTESANDLSAASVVDGEVVAFFEEERLNRVCHAQTTVPKLVV